MNRIYDAIEREQMLPVIEAVYGLLADENGEVSPQAIGEYLTGNLDIENEGKTGWVYEGAAVFAENERVTLCPVTDADKESYLSVAKCYNPLAREYLLMAEAVWQKTKEPVTFFCMIREKGIDAGYIGISDTSADVWEVTVELDPAFCGRGIGQSAVGLFLKQLKEDAGQTRFAAMIEPDNPASIRCFEALGAKYERLCPHFDDEEEARDFERRHLSRLSGEMTALSEKLGAEPRKLLSHALEYRL